MNAFTRKDQVHLLNTISAGIDESRLVVCHSLILGLAVLAIASVEAGLKNRGYRDSAYSLEPVFLAVPDH